MEEKRISGTCDKCGETVDYNEDATVLESVVYNTPGSILINSPRHLLCSPSRSQFIVHEDFEETIDERESWDKRCLPTPMRKSRESLWTSAWELLQRENSD